MKQLHFLFCLLLAGIAVNAQTVLRSEGFETNGEGSRYNTNTYIVANPTCDFFQREPASPLNTCFQGITFNSFRGSFFWGSEDIMASPGNRPAGFITSTSFNISGYSGLQISLYAATSNDNGSRWEIADSINIKASIDGGPFVTVGRFMGNGATGGALVIDANLNGVVDVGETTVVSVPAFTKYTFNIAGTGGNMQFQIDFDQLGGSEELGIDDIEVTGILTCTAPGIGTQPGNAATCAGNNASFTTAATGTAPLNYQWQVNDGSGFVNIVNGGVYSNSTTATLNITGTPGSMNGYLYRCVVTNACGNITTNNGTLTVNTTNNWTGTASTDWHNPANWSCSTVPTASTDVNITGNPPNQPVILPGATGSCRNMLKGGFSLGLTLNGATLKIHGNLTYNAGSFITNATSSFQFAGTTGLQTYSGLTPLIIDNLTINNPAGLLMGNNITLSTVLTFTAGKVFTGNNFLKAGSIAGGNSSSYIVTADASNVPAIDGGLTFTVMPGTANFFPVGPTATSYNPVTIRNTSGPAEDFNVRLNLSPLPGAVGAATIQRTWQIDEFTAAGGNTADIILQWDAAHEGALFNRAFCGVVKSNGTGIDYSGYTLQNGPAVLVSGSTWSKTLTGVTSFSPWGVTSDAVVLPVKLTAFNAVHQGNNNAIINWQADNTNEVKEFVVEKSRNSTVFTGIKTVSPVSLQHVYATVDSAFTDNINYYRLKIIEHNGNTTYSRVATVHRGVTEMPGIVLYPNPAKEKVIVYTPGNRNGIINLLNMAGAVIKRVNIGNNNTTVVLLEGVPAGLYILQLSNRAGIFLQKLTVQ